MRLWTVHPRYLDRVGLVALWREGLLARAVLGGRTRGYRHHPQLARFRAAPNSVALLDRYLEVVWREAEGRGYRFDRARLGLRTLTPAARLVVPAGQLAYEWEHLRRKLERRAPEWLRALPAG
ncbi:MAG TPA: pyrimidine dimer DNA glycosylase/endonuclease V, partial [Gemmatimonadales bacterium]|nr:pyrimidine dimer DNA glycosylase/endonuclease V [Gemmatimonadales bacterium]